MTDRFIMTSKYINSRLCFTANLTTWYMCLTSHLKIRFQLLINFYSPIAITREAENPSGINNRQSISGSHFVVHFPSNTEFLFTLLHSSPSEKWVENLAGSWWSLFLFSNQPLPLLLLLTLHSHPLPHTHKLARHNATQSEDLTLLRW